MSVAIREIREADAEALLSLQRRLDEETEMMMFEPGERSSGPDAARSHLLQTLASPNSTIIIAESDSFIVGYVEAEGGRYRRTRHSAYVVVGVLHVYQGQGVGTALLEALRSWAGQHDISRLELTVRTDNEPARRLYQRAGFTIEGVRRASLRVGEELIDELAMAFVLGQPRPLTAARDDLRVRALRDDERPWLNQQLIRLWGSTQVVSRGRAHEASALPALVCHAAERAVGIATFEIRERQCELVTLDAFDDGRGIGSALLAAVVKEAKRNDCCRLWLITSNDNLRALRFYQRRGFRLTALHRSAIDEARLIKASIPLVGEHGIAIHDELELERVLD